ncbi:MAG: hypothetical protein CSA20_04680 [Deltaproteobacteria bacterium]|nr:MAG: hypothetical protein CSA20_04680 [Deltaproteobacteria bacterium]
MQQSTTKAEQPKLHLTLFLMSVLFTGGLGALFAINPEKSNAIIKSIKGLLMNYLGSTFLFFGLFVVVCVFFLCFSSIGNIRFGGRKTQPEYSTLSWIAMIFTGGCGSSMIYWGSLELGAHFGCLEYC